MNPFSSHFNAFDPANLFNGDPRNMFGSDIVNGINGLGDVSKTVFDSGWTDTKHFDKWITTYEGLHLVGGKTMYGSNWWGTRGRDEERARQEEAGREQFLKNQSVSLAPEATAGFLEPSQELRDRRRKAVLFGISQLNTAASNLNSPGAGGVGPLGNPLS